MNYYDILKNELNNVARDILSEQVSVVSARSLTTMEAIGSPDRLDFPLIKGKEVMIEATFGECHGQAFTDMPGQFKGSIYDILNLKLATNFEKAVFVATLNAVMRRAGRISTSRHCRDSGPRSCAEELPSFIREHFGSPRIAFIGYQPAMIEELSPLFEMRVADLDSDNIGTERFGIVIEGSERTEEILSWSDLILATGSTSVNGSITTFLGKKPVAFYGVTVAGIAAMKGYRRYCPYSE